MKQWKIWGINLQPIFIKADTFDEALKEARKLNKNYCAGQLSEGGVSK